ncbi:alpha-L-arabinofuranosidase C-terminal domain-containing protein [Melioribacter sp. OK-1-Me]
MGRNFLSVLPVAQCFNSFIRNADIVKMANFTMLTSLLQEDREKGTFKTPLFYMFKSFSNNCHGFAIDTYVQCDTFNTNKYKGIPYLDVTSVYNPSTNTIMINVVNRHKDEAITAEVVSVAIPFINDAEVTVINQNSLDEPFSFDKKDKYVPSIKQVQTNGNKLVYTFEPHSFTQIKVKIKEL